VIEVGDGVTGYWQLLAKVLEHSEKRVPRGLPTLDLGPTTVVMHDTDHPLPLQTGRNLSRKIAAVEALQLVGAFSDYDLTVGASANFANFAEPGTERFHGAYGRRIGEQLEAVVRKLTTDRDTRQAVISLWDPFLDNQPGKKDYPCTLAFGFEIQHNTLLMRTVMRSQDVMWGTPYDWAQFTALQRTVANLLDIECGWYTHTTWSTHIYEQFVPDAQRVIDTVPPRKEDREWQPLGFGFPGLTPRDLRNRVQLIARGGVPTDVTKSEEWYVEQVAAIRTS
jgi:thymidylate synthase